MRRLAFVLACIALGAFTQKEVRVTRLHGDGGPGDQASLEALVGLSDAVVVGRVAAARPSNIAPAGLPDEAGDFFSTAYSLRIEQVLRWLDRLGTQPASMEVEVHGVGEVDRGTYIQRYVSERYRELAIGRTYLLFISKYARGRNADAKVVWVPSTGDGQSIIEIRAGNVAPQAATALALSLAGLTPTALFDRIRQILR